MEIIENIVLVLYLVIMIIAHIWLFVEKNFTS